MISKTWEKVINEEKNKEYFHKLMEFVESEYRTQTIFPIKENIFKAFELTPYEDVRVVILGQDPYHNYNQAHGLAFSVPANTPLPASLKNIYKEIENDLSIKMNNNGDLSYLALQGVLLLNTVLTVRLNSANSHQGIGWEIFTDNIIKALNIKEKPIIFVLWGNQAIDKEKLITNPQHYIIKSVHPSPLSARKGFFGSKPFSRINNILINNNDKTINWQN